MTAEEARQSIISQADIMCVYCGVDCEEWRADREALCEICPFCGHEVEEWKKS